MSSTLNRGLDWMELRAKPILKGAYRRPVIETARLWRGLLGRTCFIGITGSAGKTATKELLHDALSSVHRCVKSFDSDNQLYDVARTLLQTGPAARFCVQEVGASAPGLFAPMMELLRPRVGIVTNVGTDHISAFGTIERIGAEKAQLVSSLPGDGIAVLNADEPTVMSMAALCHARIVTYGLRSDAQFRAEVVTDRWPQRLTLRIHHGESSVLAETKLLPGYQASNVLAAVAAACSLGMTLEQAVSGVCRHEPMLGRLSVFETRRGVTFIRDDGKAPEWSVLKAMEYMAGTSAARKVVVIGTISDTDGRPNAYRRPVEAALAAADRVLLVGPRAAASAPRLRAMGGERLLAFSSVQDASRWLGEFAQAGDLVLLKGSTKADHLARIALAFDHEVHCWRSRCPRKIFCDRCALLSSPAAPETQ